MSLLDPGTSATFGTLQTLDDAIAYRMHRLGQPCQLCAPALKCAEHAQDESLLEGYQDRYVAIFQQALATMDPGTVEQIMQPGDATPKTTNLLAAAIITRLRKLAANGPIITELDGRPVLVELDGITVIEHPLTASDR